MTTATRRTVRLCSDCGAFLPNPQRYEIELVDDWYEEGTAGEEDYRVTPATIERTIGYSTCSRCGHETAEEVPE